MRLLSKPAFDLLDKSEQKEYIQSVAKNKKGASAMVKANLEKANPDDEGSWTETLYDMSVVVPQGMTFDWFDEALGMVSPELKKKYRAEVAKARKRSPWATTAAEILAPSPLAALKVLKLAKIVDKAGPAVKSIIAGVATTTGLTEKDVTYKDALKGFGIGVGGHVTGSILQKVPITSKKLWRGQIGLGGKKSVSTFAKGGRKMGRKEQEAALEEFTEELQKEGFFKGSKSKLTISPDDAAGKIRPIQVGAPTAKDLHQKASDIMNQGGKIIESGLANFKGQKITKQEALNTFFGVHRFLKNKRHDIEFEKLDAYIAKHTKVLKDLAANDRLNLTELHGMKRRLYNKIKDSYGKEGTDSSLIAIDKAVAYELNKLISRKLKTLGPDGESFAKTYEGLNRKATLALKAQESLLPEIEREVFKAERGLGNVVAAIAEVGRSVRPYVAKGAEIAEATGVPKLLSKAGTRESGKTSEAISRSKIFRPLTEEEPEQIPEIPYAPEEEISEYPEHAPLDRGPMMEEEMPMEPEMGMEPEMDLGIDPEMVPEELQDIDPRQAMIELKRLEKEHDRELALQDKIISTPLPRYTQKFLENADFAMAKLGAQRPDIMPQWAEMLKNAPHLLEEHLMGLSMEDPMMLEHDPFGRINDRVFDNGTKNSIRTLIAQNPEITNLKRVEQLDELNRTGIYKDSESVPEDQTQDTGASPPPRNRPPGLGA